MIFSSNRVIFSGWADTLGHFSINVQSNGSLFMPLPSLSRYPAADLSASEDSLLEL